MIPDPWAKIRAADALMSEGDTIHEQGDQLGFFAALSFILAVVTYLFSPYALLALLLYLVAMLLIYLSTGKYRRSTKTYNEAIALLGQPDFPAEGGE